MTAAHVVQDADEVMVHFLDGTQVPGKVVSSSPQADVTLLKLDEMPDNLHAVELGDSDRVSYRRYGFRGRSALWCRTYANSRIPKWPKTVYWRMQTIDAHRVSTDGCGHQHGQLRGPHV